MLFKIILGLHILFGTTGLLLGTFILIRKKGDRLHKNLGKIFTISMISTGLCAFYLSYVHPNLFLFVVGVFTIYLSVSGYRMIRLKQVHQGQKPTFTDTILSISMLMASLIFVYIGCKYALAKEPFAVVFFLFAALSIRLLHTEYRTYTGKVTDPMYGLKNHIGRMTGAYIAALTAFLVVNNTFLPPILAWSLPGLIGGIFISRRIRKVQKK
ncbi:DUF2306 domain-containing protein [Flavobacterium sp.]|uniref:DUF2306 domain-containing protein n=1 Tax=Flavobacterium sp. TaxID=239 RepID=UPI002635D989|nr:DUF2306 domain-containing protein [Flavobacterium sp.]MDG2432618.1 DUF2306 domain-containing protein [Flavobacterium sp.]